MKKALCAAAVLALMGSASAEVVIEQIFVNQSAPTPEGTNIRVNMHNNGSMVVKPSNVILQARAAGSDQWETIKTWNHPMTLLSGKRMALDYLPSINDALPPALQNSQYQLRAVVHGHGGELATMENSITAPYALDFDEY